MDVAEHTLELLKRMHAEFADFRRVQESQNARLSSLEQHVAAMMGDLAQIRMELTGLRTRIERIERRLDLTAA
ncbi:hypothetical protein E2493_08185 [Sphingomonas parva]|uniref:Uncharacterized protein n=1 Tax=Sphingomonas parva TaxID=2555898 RepID=A0A4Y8ZVT1_9SPHN|nr:hypothetical protein [Sphingomonas parva]TFI58829.1 hypothetical protein E2493_08185 [Sphingomonas parva]